MKRTSPNVLYVGDVLIAPDGAWRVTSVHPWFTAVMV